MLAHSCIIAPSGQVVALTQGRGDELDRDGLRSGDERGL